MEIKELIDIAVSAMANSHSPYSKFKVGAALISKSGRIFSGANIENSSFSATICAERTAFCSALTEGETEFSAIAIVGGKNGVIDDYCPPCGVCRQFMSEFCDEGFKIILFNGKEISEYSLGELLPKSFGGVNLC